jgi:hypothetical protein
VFFVIRDGKLSILLNWIEMQESQQPHRMSLILVAICADCTAIYMMSGWEKSKGANAELALARALGIKIFYEAPLPR